MRLWAPAPARDVKQRPATTRKSAVPRADAAAHGGKRLPDDLKSGVEALSGLAMDDVRVSYASPAADRFGAAAFAQGRAIHLAPGEERHLPHEAWHVVQQKQRRVPPTGSIDGTPVNTDPALEREADAMGRLAASGPSASAVPRNPRAVTNLGRHSASPEAAPIQGKFKLPGGNTYTTRNGAKLRVERIIENMPHPLPSGIKQSDVLEEVYKWAEDATDHGYFKSWRDLIQAVIAAIPPVVPSSSAMDLDYFAPWTPTSSGPDTPPATPPIGDYNTFGRRLSGDFSTAFETQYGSGTADVREQKVKFTDPSGASGTTFGTGRLMSLTGPKVLGDTLYAKFLKELPTLTGLTHDDLVQGLLDGLLNGEAFKTLLAKLDETQKQAITATVRLFVNEIVNRSSVNLLAFIGALQRSLTDKSKTFDQRLVSSGLFVPVAKEHKGIGGQKLSRSHHEGSDAWDKADDKLKAIHRNNRKSIGNVAEASDVTLDELADEFEKVIAVFQKNLKTHWNIEIG